MTTKSSHIKIKLLLKKYYIYFKNIIFNLIDNYSISRILKRVKICIILKRKKKNEEVSGQLMRVDVCERERGRGSWCVLNTIGTDVNDKPPPPPFLF